VSGDTANLPVLPHGELLPKKLLSPAMFTGLVVLARTVACFLVRLDRLFPRPGLSIYTAPCSVRPGVFSNQRR
jgi:hypothetical protein